MLNWGMSGPTTNYTSNREYGRGVLMSMQQQQQRQETPRAGMNNFSGGWNPNAININSQMSNYPAFTPGQGHQPTCPNFGAGGYSQGQGQAQGHVHAPNCPNHDQGQGQMFGATGGVYSTGGNSPTDFTVFVGDAATAAMGQGTGEQDQGQSGHQDYKVNYYMPEQPNVSEPGPAGNFAMNYQNFGAGDQTGQNQNQQQYFSGTPQDGGAQNTDGTAMTNQQNKPMRMKAFSRANNGMGTPGAYGYPKQTMSMADMMTPAPAPSTTSRSLGNKYKSRFALGGTASSDSIPRQHVYSSLRGNHESNPGFQLCGRCSKCKDLKDPNAGRPSVVNFKTQGLTASGGRRFPIPAAAKPQATPSLSSMAGNMILGNNGGGPAVSNANFNPAQAQAMPMTEIPAVTLSPVTDTTTAQTS